MAEGQNGDAVTRPVPVLDERQADEPVDIKDSSGQVKRYVVREMDGDGLARWAKVIASRSKVNRRGRSLVQNFDGLQAELIHLCLFDAAGNRVPKAMIASWGAYTQNYLMGRCQDINGLSDVFDEVESGKG